MGGRCRRGAVRLVPLLPTMPIMCIAPGRYTLILNSFMPLTVPKTIHVSAAVRRCLSKFSPPRTMYRSVFGYRLDMLTSVLAHMDDVLVISTLMRSAPREL